MQTFTPDRWRDKYFPEEKAPTSAPAKKSVKKPVKKPAPKPAKAAPDYSAMIGALAVSRDEQKRAADAQYSRNIADLKTAFEASGQKAAQELSAQQSELNAGSDEKLRGLYIDKELAHRDLQVQLGAKGVAGGGRQLGAIGIDNAYKTSRQNVQQERQKALDSVQKSSEKASFDEKASYEKQLGTLNSAYAKALESLESEYARLVGKLAK